MGLKFPVFVELKPAIVHEKAVNQMPFLLEDPNEEDKDWQLAPRLVVCPCKLVVCPCKLR